jgi:hypothetical protein
MSYSRTAWTIAALLLLGAAFVAAWQFRSLGRTTPAAMDTQPPARAEPSTPESPPTSAQRSPRSLAEQVQGRATWPLPAGLRLPGVRESTLADDLEGWLQTLPPEQRETARAFAGRYGVAYEFSSRAEQAWLLQHGYPSLEEVVAFDAERMMAACGSVNCQDPKISALAADFALNRIDERLQTFYAGRAWPEDPYSGLNDGQRATLMQDYFQVLGYTRHARENGSQFFAAHLSARLDRLSGRSEMAEMAEVFLSVCGDPRIAVSGVARANAQNLLQVVPGNPCGWAPGRPAFPEP